MGFSRPSGEPLRGESLEPLEPASWSPLGPGACALPSARFVAPRQGRGCARSTWHDGSSGSERVLEVVDRAINSLFLQAGRRRSSLWCCRQTRVAQACLLCAVVWKAAVAGYPEDEDFRTLARQARAGCLGCGRRRRAAVAALRSKRRRRRSSNMNDMLNGCPPPGSHRTAELFPWHEWNAPHFGNRIYSGLLANRIVA